MSLTYVITTLFRGDDIEQTEYVIGQLERLSARLHQILVFNGGLGLPQFLVPVVMRVYHTYSPCLEQGGA